MNNAQMQAALRMTDSVRWYEWTGYLSDGRKVVALSRSMMRSPLSSRVDRQNVSPYVKGAH